MRILLSPDPAENPALPAPGSPVKPQAAETVVNGDVTEALAKKKKDLETEIAVLEDKRHQIKQTPAVTEPEKTPEPEEEDHNGWAFPGEG